MERRDRARKGASMTQDYKQIKADVRLQVFEFLKNRQFEAACLTMAHFEASQPYPRGIGIDWNTYKPDSNIEELTVLFSCKPSILQSVDDSTLDLLRPAAGMSLLWGESVKKAWLPNNIETGLQMRIQAATLMLNFFVSHQRRLHQFVEIGYKHVEVISAINCCEQCREISGRRYPISKILELPYTHCKNNYYGCRCSYTINENDWVSHITDLLK